MPNYLVYGLDLRASARIPGLVALSTASYTANVEVCVGFMPKGFTHTYTIPQATPWYISKRLDENGEPGLRVWQIFGDTHFYLRYSDSTEFVIDREGTQIWARWPDNLTLEDTATYLLGPVLGFTLRLRGVTCLHASAVVIDGQAVAFLGQAGAGKSTTAAAFAQLGYPVLSDDVVALVDKGDSFLVQPAYPRIRLWSTSVAALYGSPDALPRIVPTHPTWDKRYLDLNQDGYKFQQQPLPLSAIYLLGERSIDLSAPVFTSVPTQAGLMSLVMNTYTNYLLDKAMRAQEFEVLSRLVKHISLRQVNPQEDKSQLLQLVERILTDFRNSQDV